MKGTILYGMALLLAGCVSTAPVTQDGLIHCTHSRDSSLNFAYDVKNVEVWTSEKYGVQTFSIETASGKKINLNTYEIQNFKCE
jgi:hypothetical protein